jgi:hypothetical protein
MGKNYFPYFKSDATGKIWLPGSIGSTMTKKVENIKIADYPGGELAFASIYDKSIGKEYENRYLNGTQTIMDGNVEKIYPLFSTYLPSIITLKNPICNPFVQLSKDGSERNKSYNKIFPYKINEQAALDLALNRIGNGRPMLYFFDDYQQTNPSLIPIEYVPSFNIIDTSKENISDLKVKTDAHGIEEVILYYKSNSTSNSYSEAKFAPDPNGVNGKDWIIDKLTLSRIIKDNSFIYYIKASDDSNSLRVPSSTDLSFYNDKSLLNKSKNYFINLAEENGYTSDYLVLKNVKSPDEEETKKVTIGYPYADGASNGTIEMHLQDYYSETNWNENSTNNVGIESPLYKKNNSFTRIGPVDFRGIVYENIDINSGILNYSKADNTVLNGTIGKVNSSISTSAEAKVTLKKVFSTDTNVYHAPLPFVEKLTGSKISIGISVDDFNLISTLYEIEAGTFVLSFKMYKDPTVESIIEKTKLFIDDAEYINFQVSGINNETQLVSGYRWVFEIDSNDLDTLYNSGNLINRSEDFYYSFALVDSLNNIVIIEDKVSEQLIVSKNAALSYPKIKTIVSDVYFREPDKYKTNPSLLPPLREYEESDRLYMMTKVIQRGFGFSTTSIIDDFPSNIFNRSSLNGTIQINTFDNQYIEEIELVFVSPSDNSEITDESVLEIAKQNFVFIEKNKYALNLSKSEIETILNTYSGFSSQDIKYKILVRQWFDMDPIMYGPYTTTVEEYPENLFPSIYQSYPYQLSMHMYYALPVWYTSGRNVATLGPLYLMPKEDPNRIPVRYRTTGKEKGKYGASLAGDFFRKWKGIDLVHSFFNTRESKTKWSENPNADDNNLKYKANLPMKAEGGGYEAYSYFCARSVFAFSWMYFDEIERIKTRLQIDNIENAWPLKTEHFVTPTEYGYEEGTYINPWTGDQDFSKIYSERLMPENLVFERGRNKVTCDFWGPSGNYASTMRYRWKVYGIAPSGQPGECYDQRFAFYFREDILLPFQDLPDGSIWKNSLNQYIKPYHIHPGDFAVFPSSFSTIPDSDIKASFWKSSLEGYKRGDSNPSRSGIQARAVAADAAAAARENVGRAPDKQRKAKTAKELDSMGHLDTGHVCSCTGSHKLLIRMKHEDPARQTAWEAGGNVPLVLELTVDPYKYSYMNNGEGHYPWEIIGGRWQLAWPISKTMSLAPEEGANFVSLRPFVLWDRSRPFYPGNGLPAYGLANGITFSGVRTEMSRFYGQSLPTEQQNPWLVGNATAEQRIYGRKWARQGEHQPLCGNLRGSGYEVGDILIFDRAKNDELCAKQFNLTVRSNDFYNFSDPYRTIEHQVDNLKIEITSLTNHIVKNNYITLDMAEKGSGGAWNNSSLMGTTELQNGVLDFTIVSGTVGVPVAIETIEGNTNLVGKGRTGGVHTNKFSRELTGYDRPIMLFGTYVGNINGTFASPCYLPLTTEPLSPSS